MQVIPYQQNPLWGQLLRIGADYFSDYLKEKRYQENLKNWQDEINRTFG